MAQSDQGKPKKQRLDILLVERGLVESREKAQALILAGKVWLDSQRSDKPGRLVSATAAVEVEQALRYVSRGGIKLEAALQDFAVNPSDRVCLDVGTSTGGFVDCLLQAGARRVHAVDTGAGQISWKLREDSRVILHERCNARHLQQQDLKESVSLITCDVSFISFTLLIGALTPLLETDGDMIVLVKPQFEVGREQVGKGGIVRDPKLHQFACSKVADALAVAGFRSKIIDSPILGAEGNKEFLLHARRGD